MVVRKMNTNETTECIGKNQRGAAMIEYALMVVLICVGSIAAVQSVGDQTALTFKDIAWELAHSDIEK